MEVRLKKILDDGKSLGELCQVRLPIKVSYWLKRIETSCKTHVQDYNVTREDLIKKLGEENENGEFTVKPENIKEFYDELEKLQKIEVDLGFDHIEISALGDIQIEPALLLEWIFVDNAPTPEK